MSERSEPTLAPKIGPENPENGGDRVADAALGNWFDRSAPAFAIPYGHLARFDRPIGAWLLLFPCWWSQALAEVSLARDFPNLWYLLLFLVGAFAMRGAGCAWNDIVDRDYDASVARTRSRPIPSGQISVVQALLFAAWLSLIGLLVLVQFNRFTVFLGMASLLLVAAYPFAKRVHQLAATAARPHIQVGRTRRVGGRDGSARDSGAIALCGFGLVDDRL